MTTDETPEISQEMVESLIEALSSGLSPAEIAYVSTKQLESLYTLGYRLYSAGNFKDAETIYQALVLYNYHDLRFWMGLGASLQGLENYQKATEVYGMAGLVSKLNDPEPFYYAGLCFLKLEDYQSALASLDVLSSMDKTDNPRAEEFKDKALKLIELIKNKA
jgi:type III secretion system low calcium response chaperone LcrH/SycD